MSVPVAARIEASGLTASGRFALKQTDYGITPVSIGGVVSVKDTLNISFTIVGKYVSGAVRGAPRDAIAFPGSMKTLRRRVPPEKNDRAWAASRSTPICVSSASGELTGTTGQPLPRRPPGCVGSNPDRPSTSAVRATGCKVPRQRWRTRQGWHSTICNLHNLQRFSNACSAALQGRVRPRG